MFLCPLQELAPWAQSVSILHFHFCFPSPFSIVVQDIFHHFTLLNFHLASFDLALNLVHPVCVMPFSSSAHFPPVKFHTEHAAPFFVYAELLHGIMSTNCHVPMSFILKCDGWLVSIFVNSSKRNKTAFSMAFKFQI